MFNNIIYLKGVSSQIDDKFKEHDKNKTIENINKSACKLNYKYLPKFIIDSLADDLKEQAN